MNQYKDNIFPLLDWILKKKKNIDFDDSIPSTFIINRWLSMVSIESCLIINQTVNRWYQNNLLYSDSVLMSKFLNIVLPKNNKRISYIKKKKTKKQENSELELNRECSKREIFIQNKLIEELKRLTK